jgi:glycosyltransferase involved in cell wall biosynthesis
MGISDSVILHGSLNENDLRQIYQRSHFLIHPSKSEGMSMSIIEALSCGCPILIASNADITYPLTETNSVLRITQNTADFIAKIKSKEWLSLSKSARNTAVCHFGLNNQLKRYASIINNLQLKGKLT